MNIRKLTPCEFARAIKLGLGRAFLHVVEYGDSGSEKEIEEALLNCHVYDWQIEGTRAYWVFNIAEATGRLRYYAERVLERCDKEEFSENNLAHQIQIAWQFFESGYSAFRPLAFQLYPRLIAENPYRAGCGTRLVDLAGAFGLAFAARTIGNAVTKIDDYDCSCIYEHGEDLLSEADTRDTLQSLAADDDSIRRFLDACARHRESTEAAPLPRRPRPTLDAILEKVERGEHAPSGLWYRHVGTHISDDEARKLCSLMEETHDPWRELAYLRMFANRPMPELSSKVLQLLNSPDHYVASAAADALGQLKNSLVRETALRLLDSCEQGKIATGFELLKQNYEAGDEDAIRRALLLISDEELLHSVGMDIRTMAEENENAELAEFVHWFYENGPDSWCRRYFLQELVERNVCPPEILFEAQWDGADETQYYARAILARESSGQSFGTTG
ncbi:MAG: hypothetical protein JST01_00485 [Cyanobacteria bacterium SZAS TMP-1]|nr:hypothetical protein [Cyanobacteria bacterium SZAS TMP-1]